MKKSTIAVVLSSLCTSCGSEKHNYEIMSAESIYQSAYENMNKKNYHEASEEFLEIEKQYPYSAIAIQGRLMAAYASFLERKYSDSVQILNAFIAYHPIHKKVDYAYFLLGMSYLKQISSSERSSEHSKNARDTFKLLCYKFPNSKYAKEARKKLNYLNDLLANHEMNIGRFYQNNNNFIAAIPRFQNVISSFFYTSLTPEAYYRIVESFLNLGMKQEALVVMKQFLCADNKNIWKIRANNIVKNLK